MIVLQHNFSSEIILSYYYYVYTDIHAYGKTRQFISKASFMVSMEYTCRSLYYMTFSSDIDPSIVNI